MSQKICVISFDHWNYDKHIVDALNKKGIEAFHIKIGGFKHKNIFAKIGNTLSKIFLGKNPKIQKRQEFIIKTLQEKGIQDQILVINPELIELKYHLEIKKYTQKYICYLYDSVSRCPVEHLLDGVFDDIYSFDKADIKKYGFKETTNYNYINNKPLSTKTAIKNQVLYVASFDKRLDTIVKLKAAFEKINVSYRFIIVGKKTSLFKFKNKFSTQIKNLELQRNRIDQEDLQKLYLETNIVLDIVRENQVGLSFRIFEAMAFEKKLITNNKNILNYNFYNPNNILVIENDNFDFDKTFFETNYETLPENIFYQYTLDNWVINLFNLK
jgi:glycosyltransferase involved in cell wall biosynthesis